MEQYTSKIYISFEDMQDNIPDVQIFLQIWVCIYNKTTEEGIILENWNNENTFPYRYLIIISILHCPNALKQKPMFPFHPKEMSFVHPLLKCTYLPGTHRDDPGNTEELCSYFNLLII